MCVYKFLFAKFRSPVNLCCTAAAISLSFSPAARATTQNPSAVPPHFEVATIKPAHDDNHPLVQISKDRLSTHDTSIIDLMKYSFGMHGSQIVGIPDALLRERFDIEGVVGAEKPTTSDVYKQMVRSLLAERFNLAFHAGMKELPVYVITVANPAVVLQPATPNFLVPTVGYSRGELHADNATIHDLAMDLQRYVTDRPVVDQTNLQGKYKMDIHWTPDEAPANIAEQQYPNFFTAVKEQLGLKLQAAKVPIDVMVVDKVTEPTAN